MSTVERRMRRFWSTSFSSWTVHWVLTPAPWDSAVLASPWPTTSACEGSGHGPLRVRSHDALLRFCGHVVPESTDPVLTNTGHTNVPSHDIGFSRSGLASVGRKAIGERGDEAAQFIGALDDERPVE